MLIFTKIGDFIILCADLVFQLHLHLSINVEPSGRNSINPVSKVWVLLSQHSQNSQSLNVVSIARLPKFIEKRYECNVIDFVKRRMTLWESVSAKFRNAILY